MDGPPLYRSAAGAAVSGSKAAMNERLDEALAEAEYLLEHVAEAGIDVGPEITQPILLARRDPSTAWHGADPAALLQAIAKLSAKVSPVTGDTLRACAREQIRAVRQYAWATLFIAGLLFLLSVISFVSKGVSDQMRIDGVAADMLALRFVELIGSDAGRVTLDGIGPGSVPVVCPKPEGNVAGRAPTSVPPPAALATEAATPAIGAAPGTTTEARFALRPGDPRPADLQEFATRLRSLYWRAGQIAWLQWWPFSLQTQDPLQHCTAAERDHRLQLAVPLDDARRAAAEKVRVYQHVRTFARTVQVNVDLVLDALGTLVLPILYALLGAIAYMWRTFATQVRLRTFAPSYADWSRLLTAGIGGSVIGLFPGFSLGEGPSIAPLGIAFLVGYGIDIFFSFLDSLTPTRLKPRSSELKPTTPATHAADGAADASKAQGTAS